MIPTFFGVLGAGGAGSGQFSISPAVDGKSVWSLDADGPLNLDTDGDWVIVPTADFDGDVKQWGGGGAGNGGGGGGAVGTIPFTSGTSYTLRVAFAGSGVDGAGLTGIFETTGLVPILISGGGGTNGSSSSAGGAGGGTNGLPGQNNGGGGGGGGTQASGGAGGGDNGDGSAGIAGTSLTGGASQNGSGGGGDGYFGGGSGGYYNPDGNSGGGGGGSGYLGGTVVGGTLYAGSGTTPGNAGDVDRGGAGSPGADGRLIIAAS